MAQPAPNHVPVWEPPDPADLEAVLPGYAVLALLGSGSMGAVYRAKQKSLGRFVALKVLSPELAQRAPEFTERFNNEAGALAKLSHPGIVHLFDCGRTQGGQLFIATELVEGRDLGEILAGKQALPVKEALSIAIALCVALEYAHQRGVMHRDLKPANVMRERAGGVKITDFGLARILQSALPMQGRTTSLLGTPRFTAPEVLAQSAEVDARADVFSVGVLLYQMLTGVVPRGTAPPPSELAAGIDGRLDAIVAQAMAASPSERYSSAGGLQAALEEFRRASEAKAEEAAALWQSAKSDHARPPAVTAWPPVRRTFREEPAYEEDWAPEEARSFPLMAWMSTLVVVGVAALWGWQQWKHPADGGPPRLQPAPPAEVTATTKPTTAPASTTDAVNQVAGAGTPAPTPVSPAPTAAPPAPNGTVPPAAPAATAGEAPKPAVPPEEVAETQRRIAQIQADFDAGVKEWQAAQDAKFNQLDAQYLRAVKNAIIAMRNERRLADQAGLQEEERLLTTKTPLPPIEPLASPERARLRYIYDGQVHDIAVAGAETKVEIYNRLLGSLFAYQSILRQTNKAASAEVVAAVVDRAVAERDGVRASLKAAPEAP